MGDTDMVPSRWSVLLVLFLVSPLGFSQFAKVGPLEFSSSLSVDLVLTSNVDAQPDEVYEASGQEAEDMYVLYGITISAAGELAREWSIDLGIALSKEYHFVRDDLNEDDFGGDIGLDISRQIAHFTGIASATHEVERDFDGQEIFVPGGRTNLVNNLTETSNAELGLLWTRNRWTAEVSQEWEWSRNREEFSEGDTDSSTFSFDTDFTPNRFMSFFYEYTESESELINTDEGVDRDSSEGFGVEFSFDEVLPIRRPQISYGFEYIRETQDGEDLGNDWQHTVGLDDLVATTIWNIEVTGSAEWEREQDPEEEDIELTYDITASQILNRFMRHELSWSRKPGNQFGATDPVDQTTLDYELTWDDALVRGLRASTSWSRTISDPHSSTGGETEETDSFTVELEYLRDLTPFLLNYSFEYVDESNLESTFVVHELTLGWRQRL